MRRCQSEIAATTLPSTRPASYLTFSSLICSFLVYANDCILSFDLSLSCLHVRLNPLDLLLSYLHVPLNPFDLSLSCLHLSESSRSIAFPSAPLRILSIYRFPTCISPNPLDPSLSYLHVRLNPFDLSLSCLYLSESFRSIAFPSVYSPYRLPGTPYSPLSMF